MDDTPDLGPQPSPVVESSGDIPQNGPGAGLLEVEDLGVLVGELDALVAQARSVPLLKAQIVLERESVYDTLDRMRMAIPQAVEADVGFGNNTSPMRIDRYASTARRSPTCSPTSMRSTT